MNAKESSQFYLGLKARPECELATKIRVSHTRGLVYDRILAISDFLGDSPYYNPFQCLFLAIEEIKDVASSCTAPVDLETQVIVRI